MISFLSNSLFYSPLTWVPNTLTFTFFLLLDFSLEHLLSHMCQAISNLSFKTKAKHRFLKVVFSTTPPLGFLIVFLTTFITI